jgi:hypothetical protein
LYNSCMMPLPQNYNFKLPNELVQEFIESLHSRGALPSDADQKLNRLTIEVMRLADAIQQGAAVGHEEAMQHLMSRLRYVEELSQDPSFRRQADISRIFYRRILELEAKLVNSRDEGSEHETMRDVKHIAKWFRQSLKHAIPDAPGAEEEYLAPEGALAADELAAALHQAMVRGRQVLGPSQAELDLEGELGSKWKNLLVMSYLQDFLKTPEFSIPRPVGISSSKIERFLGPQILHLWDELQELYHQRDASQPFLERPDVQRKIAAVQQAIQEAFNRAGTDPYTYAQLGTSKELEEMVTKLRETGDYAMVRSTGAEDTTVAANAGGNLSVPYVPANRAEIMQAVGAVVASYFSIDSLKNRLDAGQNPFAERLQLAVLLQQLIGEPVLDVGAQNAVEDIPSSFVCFSSEPLWVGNEQFRIMRIDATFGHGEGVVGTQGIPTDSWLILHSATHPHRLYVIPDIKKKNERLAPVRSAPGEKPELKKVPNPRELRKRPALSPAQLRTIFANAVIMEARFGDKATDFEGICRKDGTFVVQGRPVNRPKPEASYFDITESPQGAVRNSLQASPLVPGRSDVIEVTDSKQVVVAETLEQALKLYDARKGHRAVIVSRPSPLLSHAVVNFSYLGVPCLLTRDKEAVSKLLANVGPKASLQVCTQTATMHLWDRAYDPQTCRKEGYGKHPARVSLSPLSHSLHLEKANETPDEISNSLLRIRSAKTPQEALTAIRELESHPLVAQIFSEQRRQEAALQAYPEAPQKAREINQALREYSAAVTRAFREAKAAYSKPEVDRLQRLFHVEVLEALLTERIEDAGAIGRCSLMQVEPMSRAITTLIDYQQRLPRPAQFADLLLDATRIPNPDPAIFEEWREFLLNLETEASQGKITPTEVSQLKAMMKRMRKSGALPFWFMFYFKPKGGLLSRCCGSDQTKATSRSLLTQFVQDAPLLDELHAKRQQIKQIGERMDRFTHPESFEEAWTELQEVVASWSSPAFLRRIKQASPLTKSMAYQTLAQVVTTLDTAVKTLKVSSEFSNPAEHTRLFKRMLVPYHQLMAAWALNMIPRGALPTHPAWNIAGYVDQVERLLERMPDDDPQMLLASPSFSVNASVLGAGTAFERHYPQTLEDVLTLEHKNCLSSFRCSICAHFRVTR